MRNRGQTQTRLVIQQARASRRFFTVALLASIATALTGCGSFYSFRAPFDKSVRTVYVPIFRSQTYRRELNFQLTDLVIKEIEKRSLYKVVGSPNGADTILDGTIVNADKNIVVENPNNLPRELTAMLTVRVSWTHNPPNKQEQVRPPVLVSESVNFVPEVGESSSTGFYQACQRLATQIVDMMEEPWEGGDPTAMPRQPDPDDAP